VDSATQITLSQNATATGSPTLRFLPHGDGDGSTTFHIPLRPGRVPSLAGANDESLTARKPGQRFGAETHALSEAEMPSHSHTVNSHTHTGPSHTHPGGSHNHGMSYSWIYGAGGQAAVLGAGSNASTTSNSATTGSGGTGATGSASPGTDSKGSGTAHANVQPSQAVNWIIKT